VTLHALLCFASTYVAVFALGLQSLNVNQGHYWAAAGTSLLIGGGHIALYKFMPGAELAEVIGYLAGGVAGITSSMWFHRRVRAWWAARRGRRDAAAKPACIFCGIDTGKSCPRLVCERYDTDERTVH
jgi:hypothetical protein